MGLSRLDDGGLFTVTDSGAKISVREEAFGEQVVVELDGAELWLNKYSGPSSGSIGDVQVRIYATCLARVLNGLCCRQYSVVVHLASPRGHVYLVIPESTDWDDPESKAPWEVLGDDTESLKRVVDWDPAPVASTLMPLRLSCLRPSMIPAQFLLESLGIMFCSLVRAMKLPWVGWWIRIGTAGLLWSSLMIMLPLAVSCLLVLTVLLFGFTVPAMLFIYPFYRCLEFYREWRASRVY